jgi:hydrogenase maturation protein HypF
MKSIRINITGIVQGVGFRPFVANLAKSLSIGGTVKNTSGGVEIFACAGETNLNKFIDGIMASHPPNAHIAEFSVTDVDFAADNFQILPSSSNSAGGVVFVPVDLATCTKCEEELFDKNDRRYLYPFINCTECGPRYTIIRALPYDRAVTAMSGFTMCESCEKEYKSPIDRRYHAQPNACEKCGPNVYTDSLTGTEAIKETARLIDNGKIVCVKGLGGYHLVCDAQNESTVEKLREMKKRPFKPFAIMTKEFSHIEPKLRAIIESPNAPITMVDWTVGGLAKNVNPLGGEIGVMQPYNPIHKLILHFTNTPYIIATSGNINDEPIIADNGEAIEKLSSFTKHFLHHNRPILNRVDDSLVMFAADAPRLLRRGRGYAPFPVVLPIKGSSIIAVGADLKSTITRVLHRYAFVSAYIGDTSGTGTELFYKATYENMNNLLNDTPVEAVCDMHPGYFTTEFANSLGIRVTQVQHHKAHMFSVMAEYGLVDSVVGLIMDGTGFGEDGAIWGGEIFALKDKIIRRACHLEYIPMPGGDAAVKNPSYMAISWLKAADMWNGNKDFWIKRLKMAETDAQLVERMLESGYNCANTSSMGRLFEAAAALILSIGKNEFEAHTAMALEGQCRNISSDERYPYCMKDGVIQMREAIRALAEDILAWVSVPVMAARWHNTIACAVSQAALSVCRETSITDIVLSGGSFQNKYLLNMVTAILRKQRLNCCSNRVVPANDGGISLGQAYCKVWANE